MAMRVTSHSDMNRGWIYLRKSLGKCEIEIRKQANNAQLQFALKLVYSVLDACSIN